MLIETINLGKIYKNGIIALSDINLQVDFGEFVFLTGASGAGKSTLIRLLFREELPTAGQILIGGRSTHGPLSRRGRWPEGTGRL